MYKEAVNNQGYKPLHDKDDPYFTYEGKPHSWEGLPLS